MFVGCLRAMCCCSLWVGDGRLLYVVWSRGLSVGRRALCVGVCSLLLSGVCWLVFGVDA